MVEEIHELMVEGTGERLDKYIASKLPAVSRSYIQKLIDDTKVTVNNRPEKASLSFLQATLSLSAFLTSIPPR